MLFVKPFVIELLFPDALSVIFTQQYITVDV